jgi:hypothetical protein
VTDTEPMPKLVEGYTELGCSKLKNWKGFLKPNFEPGPNRSGGSPHHDCLLYPGAVICAEMGRKAENTSKRS